MVKGDMERVYSLASLLRPLLWDSWFCLRLDSLRDLRLFLRVVVQQQPQFLLTVDIALVGP
tara:strand:+ start:156 stop:338 length:183 start_codon:yes stop_codon:yes gene_type:complete